MGLFKAEYEAPNGIRLGQKVRCKVTGFEGVVDHLCFPMADATKIGVQAPMQKDGKMGECYTLDYMTIEILESKPVLKAKQSKPKFNLGDKVEDTITSFKGKIVMVIFYFNGCVQYRVQPIIPEGKKAEDYAAQKFPEGTLKKVPEPKAEKVTEKLSQPQRTGGPKEKVSRERLS